MSKLKITSKWSLDNLHEDCLNSKSITHYSNSGRGMVGIDLGIHQFLTFSNGKIYHPDSHFRTISHYFHEMEKSSIKCAYNSQLLFEICQSGENDLLQEYFNIANEICKNFEFIFVETIDFENWNDIPRHLADIRMYRKFFEILEESARDNHSIIHRIDHNFPSSKLCTCGFINYNLKLVDRIWKCPKCGKIINRDLNAAQNILAEGIKELTCNN